MSEIAEQSNHVEKIACRLDAEIIYHVSCDTCDAESYVMDAPERVADQSYRDGWRVVDDRQLLCPACLKAMKGGEDAGS